MDTDQKNIVTKADTSPEIHVMVVVQILPTVVLDPSGLSLEVNAISRQCKSLKHKLILSESPCLITEDVVDLSALFQQRNVLNSGQS